MLDCSHIVTLLVGVLVALIVPPGAKHGLAVFEERFGPVPASYVPFRPSFVEPGKPLKHRLPECGME